MSGRKLIVEVMLLGAGLAACGSSALSRPMPDDTSIETARSSHETSDTVGSLLVIGDWGSGTVEQSEIASRMDAYAASHPVQAILTTGDNFYVDDTDAMLQPFDWADTAGIAFWVSWGNHDVESPDRIEDINAAFGTPPRWATLRWGKTNILILDSNQVGSRSQMAYLEAEMERIDGPTIVVFHHPPFSCSDHRGDAPVRERWLPRFDDDVVLVLSGHAHSYQRFDVEGTQFVVSGGGGQDLQELDACPVGHPPRVAGEEKHHFLAVTQENDSLIVTAIDDSGETVDEFEVPFGG